jgi:GNAT superfamily N-acetyltransferase
LHNRAGGQFAERMHMKQFDPRADDEALDACYRLYLAGALHDDPGGGPESPASLRFWWTNSSAGQRQQAWLAADAAGPAGCYLLELPESDNAGTGFLMLAVPPDRRRHGIGSALLAHASGQARQAGRTLLAGNALAGSPGDAFAAAAGGQAGLIDVRRILAVDGELPGRLARLRAQAESAAAGYTLVEWRGPVPAEHREGVAAVMSAMSDAPRDDTIEPERWDAERVRQQGDSLDRHGMQEFSAAARLTSSGELAGLSQAVLDPGAPGWAFQAVTAVARPHRGHRLGLLVKTALHQRVLAADPSVSRFTTVNAAANEHMIAINEAMGYRADRSFHSWELTLPA